MKLTEEEKLLLDEEERELAEVLITLQLQLQGNVDRLEIESDRARTLTAEIVATRRAEDKQSLVVDEAVAHHMRDFKRDEQKELKKLLNKPYFARFMVEEEINGVARQIQYKLGTIGNIDCRIIDWRKAPLAKLYYEYQEGDEYCEHILDREREGVVLLRNKVDIQDGVLMQVTNRLGFFRKENNEWVKSDGPAKKRSHAGQLPDILSLITAEQFKTITEDSERAVLIQGIAGSGKTTVALHRLSWLLHEDNSPLKENEVLVTVRSPALKAYITESLKVMGHQHLSVLTYKEWSSKTVAAILKIKPGELKKPSVEPPPALTRLKYSRALLLALESYVNEQSKRLLTHLESELSHLVSTDVKKVIEEQKILEEEPVPFLLRLQAVTKLDLSTPDPNSASARGATRALELISSLLKRMQLYQDDIIELLKQPQQILPFDDTGLLDISAIQSAHQYAILAKEENAIDPDDFALIISLHRLKNGHAVNHLGLSKPYGHIAIDEVQDFTALELNSLIGAAKSRADITLAGDSAQDIRQGSAFSGWNKLREHWGLDKMTAQFVSLNVSHRSTIQIMKLADYVLGERRVTGGRKGKAPRWHHCSDDDGATRVTISWLEQVMERFPESLTAVLCLDQSEARYVHSLLEPSFHSLVRECSGEDFTFDEGIVVTDIETVKGLEFQNVVIWNPNSKAFPRTERGRNLLHVAITRAEDNLLIASWGRWSPLLPHVYSKLVRGVNETEDEEQTRS